MLSITFYDNIKYKRQDFINRDLDFFGNGVIKLSHFPYTLNTPADMNINIGAGVAWVDGYRIVNDSNSIALTVPAADTTNPRIDIVQIGHDDINSQAVLIIKKGVAASSPVEPDADPSYLKLFAVNVPANAISISASNITDRRKLVPLNVDGSQIQLGGYTAQDVLAKLKTVDGANSGLDADFLDGKHYADIMADMETWVNGFGLGGSCPPISNGDCNNVDVTGFFAMTGNTTDSPFSSNVSFYLFNMKLDSNNRRQMAFDIISNTVYLRYQSSGTWQAWVPMGFWNQQSVAIGVASQTLNASSDTQMTLIPQGNNFPLDSNWSTSNWTCPTAGVYEINTNIMLNVPASAWGQAKLYVNNTLDQYLWAIYNPAGSTQLVGAGSSTIKKLSAGDVLKFYGYSNVSGGTIAGNYSRINIKRIG